MHLPDALRRIAAVVTLLSACARPRPDAAPRPLTAPDVRALARLSAMADARIFDTTLVDSLLGAHHPLLRRQAALAIGQVHARVRAPRLRLLLHDADTAVAANAAFALGLLHDTASIAALDSALRVDSPAAREAAWALGEIGEPARAAIVSGLGSRATPSPMARAELLRAAGRLQPPAADAIVASLALPDESLELRRAGAYALGRSRAPAGVRVMLGFARAADGELREHAARALARRVAGDSLADSALALLKVLAVDPLAHVRINALRSLSGYGAPARAAIVAAARDSNANVRITAAQSLVPPVALQRREWTALWNADTGFMYRRSLLASAMQAGTVLPAIDEDNTERWQLQSDWRLRAAAAAAGGAAPQVERMRDISLPLTRDRDGRVRAAAYGALAPWLDSAGADEHPWRRELMRGALKDDDPIVRATAIAALAGKASAAELSSVLASYRASAADTLADARLAGVAYIAASWRRDSTAFGDSLRAAVAALPAPDDPLERRAAGDASPLARWASAPRPSRSIEWYEAALRSTLVPSAHGAPPLVQLRTERGPIVLELFGEDAPLTVANFLSLVRQGFYADARFHRVVPGFVAQDGDPRGDGDGGPGYAIRDELNRRRYDRGALGMALSGPDTGGSQYFITLSPQPHLDGHYTVFGRVRSGFDVLDALVQGDRIFEIRIP